MISKDIYSIAFMPYAPLDDTIQIGDYEVWPFYRESANRIENTSVIQHLNKIFGRYYERCFIRKGIYDDSVIKELFIISPNNFRIGSDYYSDDQIKDIKTIRNILAFCAINDSVFCGKYSDAFILYLQYFNPGHDEFAVYNTLFTNVDMFKVLKPPHIESPLIKYNITPLCISLGNALKNRNNLKIERIFMALDIYFHMDTRNEMISQDIQLLSLLMCFEVLLNYKDKDDFMNKIEEMLVYSNPTKETRTVKKNNNDTQINKSLTCWWAYDLYNLRNKIVHGDLNPNWDKLKYGNINTRIFFGSLLLKELIKDILKKENIWQDNDIDRLFGLENMDIKLKKLVEEYNNQNPEPCEGRAGTVASAILPQREPSCSDV